MLRKLFIQSLFDFKIDWMDQYIANCNSLAKEGWDWLTFTDQKIESKENFKVVYMDINGFKDLVFNKTGVKTNMTTHNVKYGDFFCSYGFLFDEFTKGYDFWGFTNFDVVYGRLSHYLPDSFLETIDVYGNDPNDTCGHFTLIRNNEFLKTLFKENPKWEKVLEDYWWQGYDEGGFSDLVKKARDEGKAKVEFRFWQEHDKQADHNPNPHLRILDDGQLINSITGNEMLLFHFRRSKEWPIK